MSLFKELKRRNVFRVAAAYVVIGWLLLQIATTLTPALHLPKWIVSGIALLLILGFIPAMLFSWVYELTPEGLKKDKDVDKSLSDTSQTAKKLDVITLVAVAGVVGLVGWQQMNPSMNVLAPPSVIPESSGIQSDESSMDSPLQGNDVLVNNKSIAVLPFANRSPDANNAFFADGVHDDLLTHLSKIADMKVISRTSVMRYADTERAIPDIANELGVATVMEGAVQRAGNRVRINVQLIDGSSDEHIWAEIYDRELTTDNIFDIQSEITRAIAAALQSVLSPENENDLAARPTQSLEAYDAYLQGMARLNDIDFRKREVETQEAFEKAIRFDPNFAAAHAGLTRAHLDQYWWSGRSLETLLENVQKSLARATALAPDSVETLIATGYYHYWGFLDYDLAAEFIDRALTKAPNNADVWMLKGFVARRAGRFDETLRAFDKALELDPLSENAHFSKVETLRFLGRIEEQQKAIQRWSKISTDLERIAAEEAFLWARAGDVDRLCQATADTKPQADWSYYYWSEVACATFRRDTSAIKIALDKIPDEEFNDPGYPFDREFEEAWIVELSGREAEAQGLYIAIANKIEALDDPYPAGWSNKGRSPALVPGLLRDLEGVRAAALDFEANATPDAFDNDFARESLAASLARAGDFDMAFDYLEQNIKVTGYASYRRLSVDPMFDDLAAHPRFKAMEPEYQKWLAAEKVRASKNKKAGQ